MGVSHCLKQLARQRCSNALGRQTSEDPSPNGWIDGWILTRRRSGRERDGELSLSRTGLLTQIIRSGHLSQVNNQQKTSL